MEFLEFVLVSAHLEKLNGPLCAGFFFLHDRSTLYDFRNFFSYILLVKDKLCLAKGQFQFFVNSAGQPADQGDGAAQDLAPADIHAARPHGHQLPGQAEDQEETGR